MKFHFLVFISLALTLIPSCSIRTVDASGIQVEKSSALEDFSHIILAGNFTFHLKPGENTAIVLKGDSAFLENISYSVKRKKLIVETKRDWKGGEPPVIEVNTDAPITHMEVAGVVKVISNRRISVDKFQIDMAGASYADLSLRANEAFINQSGAAQLKIAGAVENLILNTTGASFTDAKNLPARNVKTTVSGASKAEVFAIDRLNVTLSGASSLKYLGSPAIKSSISGNATLSVIE
ncbi:MAG: head GIN domain-containing protein [Thermaurantimonas sp.]|uniref:head GIN domain-containing protein n=1 Tax=Thermaurantimonas sp. TaxID=2681568 RepID=UPI00391BFC0A